MQNPLKLIFLSISGLALIGIGLAAGLPWLATIDRTPKPVSHTDEGTLVDHIFEFEDAQIDGVSANSSSNFGHLCANKSLYAYPGFSNGLVLRNVSKRAESGNVAANNPTLTFKFTSDKEYNVPIELSIASKYASGTGWSVTTLGTAFDSITINDRNLNYSSIAVPAEQSDISAGNYYNMQLVTIPNCRIYQGENTIVFTPGTGYLNCDYFNIKTSAKIIQTDEDRIIENVNSDVSISTEPTQNSTGTMTIKCTHSGCTNSDTFTLPRLAEGNGYDIYDLDNGESAFVFSIYEREFEFIGPTPH